MGACANIYKLNLILHIELHIKIYVYTHPGMYKVQTKINPKSLKIQNIHQNCGAKTRSKKSHTNAKGRYTRLYNGQLGLGVSVGALGDVVSIFLTGKNFKTLFALFLVLCLPVFIFWTRRNLVSLMIFWRIFRKITHFCENIQKMFSNSQKLFSLKK